MEIAEIRLFRGHHVSEKGEVNLGIIFSRTPVSQPRLITLPARKSMALGILDLDKMIAEVKEGVATANREFRATLYIEEIQYFPDDSPFLCQAQYLAYKLARKALGR